VLLILLSELVKLVVSLAAFYYVAIRSQSSKESAIEEVRVAGTARLRVPPFPVTGARSRPAAHRGGSIAAAPRVDRTTPSIVKTPEHFVQLSPSPLSLVSRSVSTHSQISRQQLA
jgi:hypothetical protein